MPSYHSLGHIPPKRHTQFRKPDGTLYSEELFGTEGFSGNYSNLYYYYPPTRVKKVEKFMNAQYVHEEWDVGFAILATQLLAMAVLGIVLLTLSVFRFHKALD